MQDRGDNQELRGNPRRQAFDQLGGFGHQIWHSVLAWLNLDENGLLHLEGAEDFDVVHGSEAVATQVKRTQRRITLRSLEVVAAIESYWQIRTLNPDKKVSFRFVTTSGIGREARPGFPGGVSGLKLWRRCAKDGRAVVLVKKFLVEQLELSEDLREFIENATNKDLVESLINPISWDTSDKSTANVREAVAEKLILHGHQLQIPPSPSERVCDRLFAVAFDKATKKKDRCLTQREFFDIFEKHTFVTLPQHLYNEFLSRLSSTSDASPQAITDVESVPPLLPDRLADRQELVARISDVVERMGVLVITGSSGSGKTILVRQMMDAKPDDWRWWSFRHVDVRVTQRVLRSVLHASAASGSPPRVVLEDLSLKPADVTVYDSTLAVLLTEFVKKGGRVVITSQWRVGSALLRRLHLSAENVFDDIYFDESDLTEFLSSSGCKSNLAGAWARVILAQTKGHAQLVHARVLNLSEAGWPPITVDEITETPSSINEIKQEAIQLFSQYEDSVRSVVYRLSLLSGPFRRDIAIAIGELPPAVSQPGEALDSVVGPWVEKIGKSYYEVSPLLQGAADQIWSKAKVKSVNSEIAEAILTCSNLTQVEARAVFQHAWTGENADAFLRFGVGLITASTEDWQKIVIEFSWITRVCLKPPIRPFPSDANANFMFRNIQFKVAARTDPDAACEVALAWDKESLDLFEEELFLERRWLLLTQVLVAYEVPLEPFYLVSFLHGLYAIHERAKELNPELLQNLRAPLKNELMEIDHPVTEMISFVVPRCSGHEWLLSFIESIEQLPPGVRAELLTYFEHYDDDAILVVNRVWMVESELNHPDWSACIETFNRVLTLSEKWRISSLAFGAAKALSVVYDEFLGNQSSASSQLDDVVGRFGESSVVDDARAMIHFRHGRYRDALHIWQNSLPTWAAKSPRDAILQTLAYRHAGVAAAELGDWDESGRMFSKAVVLAGLQNQNLIAAGLHADAGYAFWNAGRRSDAIESLRRSLENLSAFPPAKADLPSFQARKLVGHVLVWIQHSLQSVTLKDTHQPRAGMCSDSAWVEEFRELPDTPLELAWLLLGDIEMRSNIGTDVLDGISATWVEGDSPAVRFFAAEIAVRRAFRKKELSDIPRIQRNLEEAFQAYRPMLSSEFGKRAESLSRYDSESVDHLLFVSALVRHSPDSDAILSLLSEWRKNVGNASEPKKLNAWLDEIENALSGGVNRAWTKLRDSGRQRHFRLLSALVVAVHRESDPGMVFHAHLTLANALLQDAWASEVEESLAAMIRSRWMSIVKEPALLVNPKLTVPEITGACESSTNGRGEVAEVLLAARHAVHVRLPESATEWLRQLSSIRLDDDRPMDETTS